MAKYTPKPDNYFMEFINTYYNECRKRFEGIEAIAGKWSFEDLIPGLSDFDTRFVCSDQMNAKDWCSMSSVVGEVHLDICNRHPEWARLLEHLPGINPTWEELTDVFTYYPEYKQWSFYNCVDEGKLKSAESRLGKIEWSPSDEYFFLKKFLTFYGPYDRKIDPAINLGSYENKYPLHSRMMHYFTPPVQSAISVILKRPVKGKMEALRLAAMMFPEISVFDEIFDTVEKHYETESLYEEPELSNLEERLYKALTILKNNLSKHITLIPEEMKADTSKWKESLNQVKIPPQLKVFDSSKFCRLFKGRMHFYANAPAHFDNLWCIENELRRVGEMFYRTPFKVYWEVVHKEKIENPDEYIAKLVPEILTEKQAKAVLEFSRLTPGTWEKGKEEELASEISRIFDDFFMALENLKADLTKGLCTETHT